MEILGRENSVPAKDLILLSLYEREREREQVDSLVLKKINLGKRVCLTRYSKQIVVFEYIKTQQLFSSFKISTTILRSLIYYSLLPFPFPNTINLHHTSNPYKLIHINSYERTYFNSQHTHKTRLPNPKYFRQHKRSPSSISKYNSGRIGYFLRGLPQRPAINLSTNDKNEKMEANETPRNPPTSLESESRKETRGLIPFPSLSPKDNKLWKLGERERDCTG